LRPRGYVKINFRHPPKPYQIGAYCVLPRVCIPDSDQERSYVRLWLGWMTEVNFDAPTWDQGLLDKVSGMSIPDTRRGRMRVGVWGKTVWRVTKVVLKKRLKVNKEKPNLSNANRGALKTWKGWEESAKIRFLSDNLFPCQCASVPSDTPSQVERFLKFLYWKSVSDIENRGQKGTEEGEDEDENDTEDEDDTEDGPVSVRQFFFVGTV
jgi:hypothetical protein